ncbi:MAG: hypothetical protein KGL39_36470 [Patescibacteria group bacterium]|nr:hypothetical protein [Patescibacteria group bacterium]
MSLYAADGSINVTVVAGTAWTGVFAQDGSLNVIHDTTYFGVYHPCGALRYTKQTTPQPSIYAADGSINVSASPYQPGTRRVTVVSGVL